MTLENTSFKARLTDQQRLEWLRLIRSENVGCQTFYTLLNHYGSAKAALEVLPDLSKRGGMARQIKVISRNDAEKEIVAIEKAGAQLIALGEGDYPKNLREISGPPPLITAKGNMDVFALPSLAIVGSRNASSNGLKMAAHFAKELSENGFAVVSGLARGIDVAAHKASINGGTVGVFAGGLNKPYPFEHISLIGEIQARGAIISEMPIDWEPRSRDFPRRNRIISGMTMGTLVIEAAERSGTLITARLANEEGREVFAVPGSPLDPRSAGTNRLIKQGATLVMSSDDLISTLTPMMNKKLEGLREKTMQYQLDFTQNSSEPTDSEREHVLGLLTHAPTHLDDLQTVALVSPAILRVILLELTLAGKIDHDMSGVRLVMT